MSEMPKSLITQASENKVTTKGIVTTGAEDKKAIKPHLLNVSRGEDATKFLRTHLDAVKDEMINRTPAREMIQGLTALYGNAMIHESKLYRWTADYTELQFTNKLTTRLEGTPYKLVKPERGEGDVGMLDKYIDASTGMLLSRQKWIKFSDAFVPAMLSSVEVKTSTKIMGSTRGVTKHINAGYGEKNLKRSKGMVGYVHFVQAGSVYLSEEQLKFIIKRVKFDEKTGILTLKNADVFFNGLREVYAGYIVESGSVEILSVAKMNAAIRNSLRKLGMLVGVPSDEYPHIKPQETPEEISRVMYNYLQQFIAEGRANTTDEKQLKVYRRLHGIIINKEYTRSFAERFGYLIRNGDYTDFINKFFQMNSIDFRFRALNESFGIGNFEISQEFIESVRW